MTNEEKQKHIDALKYWCETNEECGVITIPKFVCDNIIEILDNAPTVEERPKGEWIRETEEDLKDKYRCSICGRRVDEVDDYLLLDEDNRVSDVYPYCHCGADMRGDV